MEFHIPTLAPDVLFAKGGFLITNTILNTWISLALFVLFALFLRKHIALRPGKIQNGCEYILEIIFGYFDTVTGSREKTRKFLPFVGPVFFFILLSNWLGLLPGTGSIFFGHAALLRPANTDLNLTAAMALSAVAVSHFYGILAVGFFGHLGKFVQVRKLLTSYKKGPIGIFQAIIEFGVGLLEIVSEFAKVLSLSLRLFGNIFAGEVLLSVMSVLMSLLLPAPFMMLELLMGLVQASVFAMLTLVYLTIAVEEPHGSEH